MGWDKYQTDRGQEKLRARMRNDSIEKKAKERAKAAAREHMENVSAKRAAEGGLCGVIVLIFIAVAVMGSLGFSLLMAHAI